MDVSRLSLGTTRRALRALREQEARRRLTIRNRWYAGSVAALLTLGLACSGAIPALADEISPAPVPVPTMQEEEAASGADPAPSTATPVPAPTPAARSSDPEGDADEEQTAVTEHDPAPPATVEPAADDGDSGAAGNDRRDEDAATSPGSAGPMSNAPATESDGIGSVDSEGLGFGIMAMGPDGPGGAAIPAPYLYWRAVDSNGNPVGGASFTAAGPRSSSSNWNNSAVVVDNTGQPGYVGLDLDPDPGEFAVKQIGSHNIALGSRYRIQKQGAPYGYQLGSTAWNEMATNLGGNGTYSFGDFVFASASGSTAGTSTIVVNARVLHKTSTPTDLNNAAHLAGVTYRLYTNAGSTQSPVPGSPTPFSCTIASGATSCTITVTGTASGGMNAGARFLVVQEAGGQTYPNPIIATGSYTGPTGAYYYGGLTVPLQSGNTYHYPERSENTTGENIHETSVLAASLNNPVLAPQCTAGIKIAVQMDLSGSVSSTQRGQYRDSLENVLDSLVGTGTQVALFTFSTNSPYQTGWQAPQPRSVDTQMAALKADIETFTSGGGNYTNWDLALRRVAEANATYDYDLVLFLTDGAPNYISNGNGTGGTAVNGMTVTVRSVERAIFSANAIKSAGTRIAAVGIGNGVSGPAYRNLAAVSGPTQNSDYYLGDWEQLEAYLSNIVNSAICRVPVTVKKETLSAQNQWTPTNGWQMTLSATTDKGTVTRVGAETQSTAGTGGSPAAPLGVANWTLVFTDVEAVGSITVSENLVGHPGYGWQSGTYVIHHQDGTQSTGNLTGPTEQTIGGIAVTDRVEVVFRNAATAGVQATKVWVVKDSFGNTLATYNEPKPGPLAPDVPPGLEATPVLGAIDNPEWGMVYSGYAQASEISIDEVTSIDNDLLPACTLSSSRLTAINGTDADEHLPYTATLGAGTNTFEITNTVTCTQTLTLLKHVDQPATAQATQADAGDWTLSATAGQATPVTGAGDGAATGAVRADTEYTLFEALAEDAHADAQLFVPAAQAWQCVAVDDGPELPASAWDAAGSVTVPLGRSVECTITNVTAELTLLKYVVPGGSAVPQDWELVATGAAGARPAITGSWAGAESASGVAQAGAANTIAVKPGEGYALSEEFNDTTLAYLLDRVERWDAETSTWVEVTDFSAVMVDAGDHAVYRFVNKPAPQVMLPLTGGLGSDLFLFSGAALIALFAGLIAWQRRDAIMARIKGGAAPGLN